MVADYIGANLGPRATLRDLAATARVLARFGPRLPEMAERALIGLNSPPTVPLRLRFPGWIYAIGGAVIGAGLMALGAML